MKLRARRIENREHELIMKSLECASRTANAQGLSAMGKEFIHLRHKIDGNELILCEYHK